VGSSAEYTLYLNYIYILPTFCREMAISLKRPYLAAYGIYAKSKSRLVTPLFYMAATPNLHGWARLSP
jgi:hypothetical protein